MRLRFWILVLPILVSACGGVGSGGVSLEDVVVQRDEVPMAYELVEESSDDEADVHRVVYALFDDSQVIQSEARRLESRQAAFDYLTSEAARLKSMGYVEERAKDMGDLNYSLSLLTDDEQDNEYVMLFVEDEIAGMLSVRGERVIFGEMYALSRYMLHHIDDDHPTPSIEDDFSEDQFEDAG